MEARSRLVVHTVDGRLRIAELRCQPPITLRRTGAAEISIVGTAAGPLGGDRLSLDIVIGAGASLTIGSVAATLVHPGVHGDESRLDINVDVGEGASLAWSPRPTVAVAGCRHRTASSISLADESSKLHWMDVLVRGRSGESSGRISQRTVIDRAGRPLLRHTVGFGDDPVADAVALGGHRIVCGVVGVGEAAMPAAAGAGPAAAWASHPLAADAIAWTAVGRDVASVHAALAAAALARNG